MSILRTPKVQLPMAARSFLRTAPDHNFALLAAWDLFVTVTLGVRRAEFGKFGD
jgi:hypothetical protein